MQRKSLHHDAAGDEHYDVISAFIKSLRGRRPGRGDLLAGPDAARRRGSAVPGPPDHDLRRRGRGKRRPAGADPRPERRGGAGVRGHARRAASRLAQAAIYVATAPQVERRLQSHRRGAGGGAHAAHPAGPTAPERPPQRRLAAGAGDRRLSIPARLPRRPGSNRITCRSRVRSTAPPAAGRTCGGVEGGRSPDGELFSESREAPTRGASQGVRVSRGVRDAGCVRVPR